MCKRVRNTASSMQVVIIVAMHLLMFLVSGTLVAQYTINGQASSGFVKAEKGISQYSFNDGRGTFVWRLDLFAGALLSDNIAFLTNVRILQDQIFHVDYFALRMMDIGGTGINVEGGEIDIPFGNLGPRRFPKQNPFFSLPLMNEHVTALGRTDYHLWTLDPIYASRGDGVRLLDGGLYDLGFKLYGGIGCVDYSFGLINGMVSTTGTYQSQGLNAHHGFGKVGRLAVTPTTGLTIGVSYAVGPFMKDLVSDSTYAIFWKDPNHHLQHIVGGDLDFSRGYFSFYGQALYNSWQYDEMDLKAFAYSLEGRYAVTPRISVASRVGGIVFSSITSLLYTDSYILVAYGGKWDSDMFRLETAFSYRPSREMELKLIYEWNRTIGVANDPHDDVLVLESVLSF